MTSLNKARSVVVLSALLLITPWHIDAAQADSDEEHKAHNLSVLNYVTGWSLDSAGYHPAVYMLLENTSGRDLTGVTIKMQGKFTDIHTLEPSTAKVEVRRSLKPHQQFPLALIAPKDFELPRDTNVWPVMECKAMMRVGSVSDEGTEYLLVTKIDSATSTQDDAFQKLNEVTSYNRGNSALGKHDGRGSRGENRNGDRNADEVSHTQPLIAKAEHLKHAPPAVSIARSGDLFSQKPLPGLGEDFYSFEKSFGLPLSTDARKKDFTWAKYKQPSSGVEIVVGSKERTGKADLIAFVLPKNGVKSDQDLIENCKQFSGTQHSVKLSQPSKSVRYLPAGRLEMLSSSGPGMKILAMVLPEAAGRPPSYLVMISRLGAEPDEILRSHQATCEILQSLPLGDLASDKG